MQVKISEIMEDKQYIQEEESKTLILPQWPNGLNDTKGEKQCSSSETLQFLCLTTAEPIKSSLVAQWLINF